MTYGLFIHGSETVWIAGSFEKIDLLGYLKFLKSAHTIIYAETELQSMQSCRDWERQWSNLKDWETRLHSPGRPFILRSSESPPSCDHFCPIFCLHDVKKICLILIFLFVLAKLLALCPDFSLPVTSDVWRPLSVKSAGETRDRSFLDRKIWQGFRKKVRRQPIRGDLISSFGSPVMAAPMKCK